MNLFVYEHITSGALINEALPASLAHEGNTMLVALINDLVQLADINLIILRDHRLAPLPDIIHYHQCYTIHSEDVFQQYYDLALNQADAVLPIAPETGYVLSSIQQSILDSNTRLLASNPKASILCSDKYRCYQHLTTHNIATVATVLATEKAHRLYSASKAYIVKPRDGAGCIDTLVFKQTDALELWLEKQPESYDNLIIQPYIEGHHLSLSILCSDSDCMVLAINQQHIKHSKNQLIFCGCTVNGASESQLPFSAASKLAKQVYHAIEGLWGLIGIDLIVTENAILVVDINPRLTSSYVGLANSIKQNPAGLLFSMIEHNTLPSSTQLQHHPVGVHV